MTELLKHFKLDELSAVILRDTFGIRPIGQLGTCGWYQGKPWTIAYVKNLPKGIKLEV